MPIQRPLKLTPPRTVNSVHCLRVRDNDRLRRPWSLSGREIHALVSPTVEASALHVSVTKTNPHLRRMTVLPDYTFCRRSARKSWWGGAAREFTRLRNGSTLAEGVRHRDVVLHRHCKCSRSLLEARLDDAPRFSQTTRPFDYRKQSLEDKRSSRPRGGLHRGRLTSG